MIPLRQVRRLKYLDYYVPVQEYTLPKEEYALEGELFVEHEIEGELTVVAPSQVKFVNLPPIRDKNTVNGYSDADWAGELPGCKSTSGYVFMINGGAVSWKSQTQPVVALSTAEAEYVAISEAAKAALYLCKVLAEFKQTDEKPVVLFEDSSAAAIWTKNETDHQKSQHIDARYHHIRDHIAKGDIL